MGEWDPGHRGRGRAVVFTFAGARFPWRHQRQDEELVGFPGEGFLLLHQSQAAAGAQPVWAADSHGCRGACGGTGWTLGWTPVCNEGYESPLPRCWRHPSKDNRWAAGHSSGAGEARQQLHSPRSWDLWKQRKGVPTVGPQIPWSSSSRGRGCAHRARGLGLLGGLGCILPHLSLPCFLEVVNMDCAA